MDTGADGTSLLPTDGGKLQLDYSLLENPGKTIGIGGPAPIYRERAIIVFTERKKTLYLYEIDLVIIPPNRHNRSLPSLLGRNILDRWRMHYSPTTKRLLFQVKTYDHMIPIG